jgi:hypothetical protein
LYIDKIPFYRIDSEIQKLLLSERKSQDVFSFFRSLLTLNCLSPSSLQR